MPVFPSSTQCACALSTKPGSMDEDDESDMRLVPKLAYNGTFRMLQFGMIQLKVWDLHQ